MGYGYNTPITFSICLHITLTFSVVFEYQFVILYMNITCFSDDEKQTVLKANTLPKSHNHNLLSLCFLVHSLLVKNLKAL